MIEEDGTLIGRLERCTQLLVQTVGRNLKFRSSLMVPDPFTVGNVIRNIGRKDFSRGIRKKA